MRTKHKLLSVILVLVVCMSLVFGLVACDKTDDTKDEATDSGKYITNGNFELTTSDVFPKTPSSWSGSAGSNSSDNSTPVDEKSLISGVIDTEESVYNKEKKNWGRLANPQAAGEDTNILMIYNRKPNSYKYVSSSFSLGSDKYFSMTFAVKTVDMTADSYGAYVAVGGDGMVEFENINTKGEWATYNVLFKTSSIESNSINITVSNGRLGKNDGKLSEGYALFDNFVVKEINADDWNNNTTASKVDMTLGDPNFSNISGNSNPYSARQWSGVSSTGSDGETAPTGSDYIEKGIVDFNAGNIPSTIAEGFKVRDDANDSRVLMINNKKATAYSYRSDSKIAFAPSSEKAYKLGIWVRTQDITGNGAYIKLKSTTEKDEQVFMLNNIKSDGEWTQVFIYIAPDTMRNKNLYIELGLGTGGKNDKETLVSGQVFFDDMTLEQVDMSVYEAAEEDKKVSLNKETTDIFENEYEDIYTEGKYTDDGLKGAYRGTLQVNEASETAWDTTYGAYPGLPADNSNLTNIIAINNKVNTITKFRYENEITIEASQYYRLSFWVKTDILKESHGLTLGLYKKADNEENSNKPFKEDEKIASFDNINTTVIGKDTKTYNGYVELVYLIEGDFYKPSNLYFQFELGSGSNLTPSSMVTGNAYIASIGLSKVNYTDYNSESGTYIKKQSLRSQSSDIDNASFDKVDLLKTAKRYDKNEPAFDEAEFLTTNANGFFGLPSGWTYTSDDQLDQIYAGIFNISDEEKNNAQKANLGFAGASKDSILQGMLASEQTDNNGVLAIQSNSDIQDVNRWGFTSGSISLSKNKFYEISVWARVNSTNGAASIILKSSGKSIIKSFTIKGNTEWTEYKFYIKTGFDDFSAYLELAVGDANIASSSIKKTTALFDMPKLVEIDEDKYLAGEDKSNDEESNPTYKAFTFTTTTFDNVTVNEDENALDTPANWTGEHKDTESPNGEHKSISGVYNRDHGKIHLFGLSDGTGAINSTDIYNIMNGVKDADGVAEGENNANVLVINNAEASEYTYTTTLAKNSLVANSYYKISLQVLTHNLSDGATANIRLKLHNDTFEFSKNDARGINVNTNDVWTTYTYYIKTGDKANIDNVELSVGLGKSGEDNYVSGYLFVDNIVIDKITEDVFDEKVPEDKFPEKGVLDADFTFDKELSATNHRIFFEKSDLNTPEAEEEEEKADPLLWLYITSGIVGGLVVIAVIVFLFKKFDLIHKLFPKKNMYGKNGPSYDRKNVNANKTTTSSKDINEKHKD